MKKYLIAFLVLIIFLGTNVYAANDKTMVIELPSNKVDIQYFLRSITVREHEFLENEVKVTDDILYNQSNKPIIKQDAEYTNDEPNGSIPLDTIIKRIMSKVSYTLLDGVTEEDCIFDITDEIRNKSDYNKKFYEGYNKVKLIVKEIDYPEIKDPYVVDLVKYKNIHLYDMTYFDYYSILLTAFNGESSSLKISELVPIKNDEDKVLAVMEMFIGAQLTRGELKITVSEDITEEDDIIYVLTDRDKVNISKVYGIFLDDYSRIILKFSDKTYSNNDDYIIDLKTVDSENYDQIGSLLFFIINSTDGIDAFEDDITIRFYNTSNNVLFELTEDSFLPNEDVTYEDNVILELDDNIKEHYFNNLTSRLLFKVADPEFIEGKNQEYTMDNDEALSFKLNIPYEKFTDGGKLYINNELVDPSNYTVENNMTTIVLKPEYVDTLALGSYEIRVEVLDGQASTTFNLVKKEVEEEINPQTFDNSYVYLSVFVMSVIGLLLLRKKYVK